MYGPLARRSSCRRRRGRVCRVQMRLRMRESRDVRVPILELVARRHRVPYVHVPILPMSMSMSWSQWLLLLRLLRRRDERRVCFRARWRPVWRTLVTCGRMRPIDLRRRVLVLLLLLLMTVRVRLRLRWREPRLGRRLKHVTRNASELVAVCW